MSNPVTDPWEVPAAAPLESVPWRRLSPLMLLVHPFREAARLVPVLIVLVISGGRNGTGELWALVGAGLLILVSIVRWLTTSFQITPATLELRTGLLRKSTITVPADRIRTVDVTQHMLHRILGLARVSIGTGTNDEHKSELVLDGLSAAEAAALRGELLHRPLSAPPPQLTQTNEPIAPEHELLRLNPAWLRYAPFTLTGLAGAFAFLEIILNTLNHAGTEQQRDGAINAIARHLHSPSSWTSVLVVLAVAVVVILVISLVGYVLAFWNFRLTRHSGGTLQVSRGLLTVRTTSIEDRRLRGVELSTPLPLRLVGGAKLIALATGLRVGRGAARGGSELTPPAPAAVVSSVAAEILAGHGHGANAALAGPLRAHPRVARRRRLVRAVVPALLLGLAILALAYRVGNWWLSVVAVLILLGAVTLGQDRYAALGHAVDGQLLVSRYGSLLRRRSVLESGAIIGWNERRTFFQRRAGLATLVATTAAGGQQVPIIDLTPADAQQVMQTATPGLLEQFLA